MLITRTHFADRAEGILTLPDGQQIGSLERPWLNIANKASQLEGCIAPCMYIKDGVGYGSREACELILKWFGDDSFVLEIR